MGGGAGSGLGAAPAGGDLTDRETLRKTFHLAAGLPAFALRFLSWPAALALALGLLLFNLLVWPRVGGRALWRARERRRGVAPGVLAYPAVLVLAVLLFRHRLELAAATWALLAFGDGAAALVGRRLPLGRLPWNRAKSWGGSVAYWLVGWAASGAALVWTAPGRGGLPSVLAAGCLGALVGALVESLPGSVDDNWTAPLLGAGVTGLVLADPAAAAAVGWLAGSGLVAAVTVRRGWLSADGAIAAAVVGGALGAGLGWRGWGLLALFFVSGVAVTRPEAAASGRGRRGDQVLANGGIAALAALLLVATGADVFRLAALAALIEAAVDTVSGEIGQRLDAPARLVTSWRRVPAGTNGAVSWPGTGAGLVVAAAFVAVAAGGGLLTWSEATPVALAATFGAGLDSVLGATLERSGRLDNQGVNLVSTASAALIAACWTTL